MSRKKAPQPSPTQAPEPERISTPDLPGLREELMALHAEERRHRAQAELGSPEYRAAVERLAAIEIQIARVERAMDPPRV